MTGLIRTHVATFSANTQTIVFMSDLDELPARHTVDLLKNCDFGPSIHLQLRDYLYRYASQSIQFFLLWYGRRLTCSGFQL